MINRHQNITIRPKGPYLVRGNVPLVRISPVVSEHNESVDWKIEETLETPETYRLCRCGQSRNKPFCDGTHTIIDFDGRETADPGTMDHRQQEYQGDGITLRDDRSLCAKAGFCANRLTDVWQLIRQSGDAEAAVKMAAMVEKCPSGALTYALNNSSQSKEPFLPLQIAVVANGPLWVRGRLPIHRRDAQPLEARNRVTLCRCGASANKPLCDGSHLDLGFSDLPGGQTTSAVQPVILVTVPKKPEASSEDPSQENFTPVALTSDLAPGEKKMLRMGSEWVLLINLEGEYRAIEGRCTHSNVALVRGQVDGDSIVCPLHKSIFDTRTGKVMAPPATRPIKIFPVKIEGDQILVGPAA